MAALVVAGAAGAGGGGEQNGPLFRLGPQQLGLSLGYGRGVEFAGSGLIDGHRVRELIVLPHWQIDLTRPPADRPPAWYAGTLALRAEGTLLVNFSPQTGVAGGLGLLLRYQLLRWQPLVPHIEVGAGVIGLAFDLVDQADGLAFIPQGGVGIGYRVSPRLSLDLAWRFQHISNAYTHLPNGGIDSSQILLGLAYRLQ